MLFTVGSLGYEIIEIIWRGFTHWTMGVTGGFCCVCVHLIHTKSACGIIRRSLRCCGAITAIELVVGVIVNRVMKWNVWDYSEMKMNVLGQICPLYSFMWFLLSVFLSPFCRSTEKLFRKL